MLMQEEPELVTFARFLVICFHGTPAKPKLPGQNTEHCEQTVDARSMVRNISELDDFRIFPEIKNALPLQAEFRNRLIAAAGPELAAILGKGAEKWKKKTGRMQSQFFTFGPSGSGDKLHEEHGLPFFDILLHGSRRWLLLEDKEMQRVAEKAREALEFDKTSAYMFFEEKLPELIEEFGLKKYVEINQNAGDLVFVPSGWFRVSLSLADSISYYETMLSEQKTFSAIVENSLWKPQYRQFALASCYDVKDLHTLPGMDKGSQMYTWLKDALGRASAEEHIGIIMDALFSCGSALSLAEEMPKLSLSDSQCTPQAWVQCRKQLKALLKDKPQVKLDWLPEDAPRKVSAIKMGSDEL
jgi:hypothetical protein